MKYFLITLLAFFLVTACDNAKKYNTEITEIDSFQSKLDSLETELNSYNLDSLNYMQKEAEANEGVIKKYYLADTINMTFGDKLDKNKGVRKRLIGVDSKKTALLKELSELKIQFKDLKTDVLEGLYNASQINDYLNVERLDYKLLDENVKAFDINIKKQKRHFYYANPAIKLYCEELLSQIEK